MPISFLHITPPNPLIVSFVYLLSSVYYTVEDASFLRPHVAYTYCTTKRGMDMQGWAGNKIVLCMCVQNYYGANYYGTGFIAPIPDPKQIPSPYPCPAEY